MRKDADCAQFEQVLQEAIERASVRLLAYCVMPDHRRLVVWPRKDGDLSRFIGWLSLTHAQRWHARRRSAGAGQVYRGRFRSFPVQQDDHLLKLCRHVERNPHMARLVRKPESWRWSSLWRRVKGTEAERAVLSPWPVETPRRWVALVNAAQPRAEVEAIRTPMQRGRPFGADLWVKSTCIRLNLQGTLRPRGRPAKSPAERKE